ncbi:hypothetical protein EVAR_4567_1 [Eumeta japonica]|uniref:Uncharacterized protein n=1 Tax=Eumeta variegata TaxID=151549 RepID=A0A4C1SW08_EUMVA|nr:hypothetical protein EVAR_4567_1 [Eumeta japonica]
MQQFRIPTLSDKNQGDIFIFIRSRIGRGLDAKSYRRRIGWYNCTRKPYDRSEYRHKSSRNNKFSRYLENCSRTLVANLNRTSRSWGRGGEEGLGHVQPAHCIIRRQLRAAEFHALSSKALTISKRKIKSAPRMIACFFFVFGHKIPKLSLHTTNGAVGRTQRDKHQGSARSGHTHTCPKAKSRRVQSGTNGKACTISPTSKNNPPLTKSRPRSGTVGNFHGPTTATSIATRRNRHRRGRPTLGSAPTKLMVQSFRPRDDSDDFRQSASSVT